MKILVTGGAGFIGSNFAHYWVKNHPDDGIVVLDKLTYAGNLENLESVKDKIKFIKGDICQEADVEKAIHSSRRKILQRHYIPQPPDFPISRAEPAYLKTVWLRIGYPKPARFLRMV